MRRVQWDTRTRRSDQSPVCRDSGSNSLEEYWEWLRQFGRTDPFQFPLCPALESDFPGPQSETETGGAVQSLPSADRAMRFLPRPDTCCPAPQGGSVLMPRRLPETKPD